LVQLVLESFIAIVNISHFDFLKKKKDRIIQYMYSDISLAASIKNIKVRSYLNYKRVIGSIFKKKL